jgi:hypothetical protein
MEGNASGPTWSTILPFPVRDSEKTVQSLSQYNRTPGRNQNPHLPNIRQARSIAAFSKILLNTETEVLASRSIATFSKILLNTETEIVASLGKRSPSYHWMG